MQPSFIGICLCTYYVPSRWLASQVHTHMAALHAMQLPHRWQAVWIFVSLAGHNRSSRPTTSSAFKSSAGSTESCCQGIGVARVVNGTDIICLYMSPNPFRKVKIRSMFESGYSVFDPYLYLSIQSWIHMMSITIRVIYATHLKISVSDPNPKEKYKNKYGISNIHPYSIWLHP